jgi:hypothetical protein
MKKYGQYPSIIHNVIFNSTIVARLALLYRENKCFKCGNVGHIKKLKLIGGQRRVFHSIDNVRLGRKRHQDRQPSSKRARDNGF